MAKIINGNHLFQNSESQTKILENRLEFYRNFLLLYEGIDGYDKYYLTFHNGLLPTDEFVDIYCPHCGYTLNETTLHNHKVWVHGKQNATDDLDDRSNWGILETVCPDCGKKTVVILE